jgi:Protein of unknown function (DUF4232)
MRLPHLNTRRLSAAIAMAGAGVLLPAIALASPGSPATASHTSAAAARCPAGSLTDWVGVPGSGAAGSTYYMLELSNTSGATCTLYGFPGVSAVGAGGHQLGSAAQRSPGHSELLLTLRRYQTVHVVLQITDVGVFSPAACHPASAIGLRVYAPGAYTSKVVSFPFRACASPGPVFLHVSTTIGGTGIPGVGG